MKKVRALSVKKLNIKKYYNKCKNILYLCNFSYQA